MESKFYRKILIATDGSENTKKAISYGLEIARISGAKVYTLYVVDMSSFFSMSMDPMDPGYHEMYNYLQKEGEEATREVKEAGNAAGIEVEEIVAEGHPSNEIINYAKDNNIDLIVMGTLGKTGIDKFLLGGVAEKVIRNSRTPVMIVRE